RIPVRGEGGLLAAVPVRPAPVDEARTRVVSRRRRRGRRGLGAIPVDDERVGEVVRHAGFVLGELADRGFRPVAAEPSCPHSVDVSNRRPRSDRVSSCGARRSRSESIATLDSMWIDRLTIDTTDLTLRCDPGLLEAVQSNQKSSPLIFLLINHAQPLFQDDDDESGSTASQRLFLSVPLSQARRTHDF
ncbi:hypothetical protein THAOC_01545, partial [Thalassiosira oceanica]